ncbi:hypothetical protein ABNN70_05735 [Sporolactobacillus sp. Y61]|uniref:VOC domain-containing protein n=1 Tax=Sporolactobacillus sp. Y61 TaxID=3160863 RepID=A0AAU8III4_9BACL
MLESWEEKTAGQPGAINHIALDTNEIEKAFRAVKELNVEFKDEGIQELPYWEHGIKYFNFFGPNREIFEVCQILK